MKWNHTGATRPEFADQPAAGQESVWDYPRPPVIRAETREVRVSIADEVLITTRTAMKVCETAAPPTWYVPLDAVAQGRLVAVAGQSYCEWKGVAQYWGLTDNGDGQAIGWSYPQVNPSFAALADTIAFYPSRVECYVDDVRVLPQPGNFYGGWITPELVGPFKGEPGTEAW